MGFHGHTLCMQILHRRIGMRWDPLRVKAAGERSHPPCVSPKLSGAVHNLVTTARWCVSQHRAVHFSHGVGREDNPEGEARLNSR